MPMLSFCLHLDTHYCEDSSHFYADEKPVLMIVTLMLYHLKKKNTHYREDSSQFYAGEKTVLMILTLTLHHFKQR